MKQLVDIETWERKNHFKFFASFFNPNFSVTTDVECGNAKENAKSKGHSFFIYYLYAILRAANEIKELRYRMENEKVVLYDRLGLETPVKTGDNWMDFMSQHFSKKRRST
jgi:chloramphenicol O-acetyltransferase type A